MKETGGRILHLSLNGVHGRQNGLPVMNEFNQVFVLYNKYAAS